MQEMKNTIYLMLLLILGGINTMMAQSRPGWEVIYPSLTAPNGDGIECARQTADGGYIMVGVTGQNSAAGDNRVVKVDDRGVIQWANTYPQPVTQSWAHDVDVLPDGYMVLGQTFDMQLFQDVTYLQKLDLAGNELWIKTFPEATIAQDGEVTADGGYIQLGFYNTNSATTVDTVVLIKTDVNGDRQWVKRYVEQDPLNRYYINSITQTSTEEYVVYGKNGFSAPTQNAFLWKFDTQGDSLWIQNYGNTVNHPEHMGRVLETSDGGYIIASNDALSFGEFDAYLFKTDANGNLQWEQRYGQPSNSEEYLTDLDFTPDGGYIASGYRRLPVFGVVTEVFLMRFDAVGNLLWERSFTGDNEAGFNWKGYSVETTSDSGYVVGACKITSAYSREFMYLIKTDSLGYTYNNIIEGNVYDDMNANCLLDAGEQTLEGWTILADGATDFWASTDSNGFYHMRVDTGNYDLILYGPNPNLYEASSCSNDTLSVYIPNYGTTTNTSFVREAIAYCPLLDVSISTPFLRRCFTNTYYVNYCNNGTLDADSAYIDISFDQAALVDTSLFNTPPFMVIDSLNYRFYLGTVGINDCGNFSIPFIIDCNSTVLGQTHCTEAHIYPDTSCLSPVWTGPIIEIEGECLGDSIVFSLTNTGADMATSLNYLIYEDNVLVRPGTYMLNNAQTTEISIFSANNSTYRIEAEQAIGLPGILGDQIAALVIDGCQGATNTGFVTQLSNFDGSPFLDIDCQENIGAYDPNDKRGFPMGYGNQHYIYEDTDLDYHIRFQNTGTDTAFTVVIRDTISPYLDITTLQPNVSSHNYTWQIFGDDVQVVEFTFSNIMLVDSNTNEPLSHGFIQFSIEQMANNPLGTVIENSAAIYFDFNEPIITNTTHHEIGEDFVEVNIVSTQYLEDELPVIETTVYPNPFTDVTTIEISGYEDIEPITFTLYDMMGRQVEVIQHSTTQFQLERNQLSSGIYYYSIQNSSDVIDSGQLIVR